MHDLTDCCHAGLRGQSRALAGGAWSFQTCCAELRSCHRCQSGDGFAAAQLVPAARQRHAAGAVASSGPHAHGMHPDKSPLHVPNIYRLRLQLSSATQPELLYLRTPHPVNFLILPLSFSESMEHQNVRNACTGSHGCRGGGRGSGGGGPRQAGC